MGALKGGQQYGKIKPPKPQYDYYGCACKTPSEFWNEVDTLWRCKCGKVWVLEYVGWRSSTLTEWIAAGGTA